MVDSTIEYRDRLGRRFTSPRDKICAHFLNRPRPSPRGSKAHSVKVRGLMKSAVFSIIVLGISEGRWRRKWKFFFFGSQEIRGDQLMEKNDDTSHKSRSPVMSIE